MCAYCFAALGTFVGGVALAKAGALATAKVALVGFVLQHFFIRR
jgi:hypothetical protein